MLAVSLTAFGSPAFSEPVRIGVISPLSGTAAFDGMCARDGALAAAQYINARGGILGGRPIELIIEDSATDPLQAGSAAQKLINSDNVVSIIGAFNSSATAVVMEVAQQFSIPHVTAISTAPALTEQGNEWFFRAVGTSQLFISSFARTIFDEGSPL
jgi:branched-chain amino acid transport system substrate-binding protein